MSNDPKVVPLDTGYSPEAPQSDVRDLQWSVVGLRDEIERLGKNLLSLVALLKQQTAKLDELLEQRK